MSRLVAAGLIGALLAAAPAGATRQGAIAERSSGSVSITASVAGGARLAGIADTVAPDGDGVPVCLTSNTATRAVSLTAAGSGADGAFTVAADGTTMPYSVHWADAANHAVTAGSSFTGTGATSCTAATAPAARLIVASAARPGTRYAGTLSLLVAPE